MDHARRDNSRTAHNYTVLSYNNASVDSSSGTGLFSLTIREFHQNEKRQGEGSYVTVQGGMRGQYDTIVYQVMFDCPNQRFRKSGNEYFLGVRRLANQGEPPPLSDWQCSDQEGTTVMALRAFCRLRG